MLLTKYINSKIYKIILISLYISLIIGFLLNEDSSGGAEWDFTKLSYVIQSFLDNFSYTLNNYEEFQVSHYPYYYIFLSWLLNAFGSFQILKIIILHLSIFLPFLFYKILRMKFTKIDKNYLIILSGIFFLSPYFRSSAIWGLNDNIALIFFSLSIFFYLKIDSLKNKFLIKILYIFLQAISLAAAAYIRQYYAIFFIYFFIKFIFSLSLKELIFYSLVNAFLALPALNQTLNGNLNYSMNFFTKDLFSNLILFMTIFSFYIIPLYMDKINIRKVAYYYQNHKFILILLMVFSIILFFIFNYTQPYGGGVFYKILQLLKIPYMFILIIFISTLLIFHFVKDDIINNLLILIPFSFITMISAIFQKYFDPLSLILIFSLFKSEVIINYINNVSKNLIYLYSYCGMLLCGSLIYYN